MVIGKVLRGESAPSLTGFLSQSRVLSAALSKGTPLWKPDQKYTSVYAFDHRVCAKRKLVRCVLGGRPVRLWGLILYFLD